MKKIICILLLIGICFGFVSCSNKSTIQVVEKIVEVPVEKIVEVPVEVPVETFIVTTVKHIDVKCYDDYNWTNLKEGDLLENILCNTKGIAKQYSEEFSIKENNNKNSIDYIHSYSITECASNIRLCSAKTRTLLSGIITGTIKEIHYNYNSFGYLNTISLYTKYYIFVYYVKKII